MYRILASHATKLLWLGIPDDAIIGALHIKTIHLSEVKSTTSIILD